jgi:hypothetical protein
MDLEGFVKTQRKAIMDLEWKNNDKDNGSSRGEFQKQVIKFCWHTASIQ